MSEIEERPAGTLRGFAAYLRRPQLIAPSGLRGAAAWRSLAILFALQLAVTVVVLGPFIGAWQAQFDLPSPDAFDQIPEELFLPLVVLIMPMLEELLFRGWLTGRKRALWLLLCAAVLIAAGMTIEGENVPPAALIAILGSLIAAPVGWFLLRKQAEPPQLFAKAFPVIFYAVPVGFALVHLSNYPSFSALAVPMVLPQLWIGLMLGYIRMRIGLWGSILAHVSSNGAVLALAQVT